MQFILSKDNANRAQNVKFGRIFCFGVAHIAKNCEKLLLEAVVFGSAVRKCSSRVALQGCFVYNNVSVVLSGVACGAGRACFAGASRVALG